MSTMSEDAQPRTVYTFGNLRYDFGTRTFLMGILNVTPDSFSDGGRFLDLDKAVEHARELEREGADFIDVEGSRPAPGRSPSRPTRRSGASCR